MTSTVPTWQKSVKNNSVSEEILDLLVDIGFLNKTTELKNSPYNSTLGQLPYIPTAISMHILTRVYAEFAKREMQSNKNIQYKLLSDPDPLYSGCEYNEALYNQLELRLHQPLTIGQTDLIVIYGGHTSMLIRGKNKQGKINYIHLDSSTADGGVYTPATGIYNTIQKVHGKNNEDYHISANRDKIQVRTPGCNFFTLKYFHEFAKTLLLNNEGTELSEIIADKKMLDRKTMRYQEIEKKFNAITDNTDSEANKLVRKQMKVIHDIDAIHKQFDISPIELPPEMAIAAESSKVFRQLESSDSRFSQELKPYISFNKGKMINGYHAHSIADSIKILEQIAININQKIPNAKFSNPINPDNKNINLLNTVIKDKDLLDSLYKNYKENSKKNSGRHI